MEFISLQTVSVSAYGKVVFGIKSFCDVIEVIFITDTFARNSLVIILWRKFIIFQNFIAGECECTSCAKFYLAYILMSVHRHVNTSVANLTEVLPRIVSQTAKLGNSLTLQQNLASGRIEVIKDNFKTVVKQADIETVVLFVFYFPSQVRSCKTSFYDAVADTVQTASGIIVTLRKTSGIHFVGRTVQETGSSCIVVTGTSDRGS